MLRQRRIDNFAVPADFSGSHRFTHKMIPSESACFFVTFLWLFLFVVCTQHNTEIQSNIYLIKHYRNLIT